MSDSRGIRNCNPGNIRKDGTQWLGMSPLQTDPSFVQFITAEYGIRAIAKVLHSYKEEGLDTIRKAITRWAPPSDNNDTPAYVAFVSQHCQLDADAVTDLDLISQCLIEAIIEQENGEQPYLASTIAAGITLAKES